MAKPIFDTQNLADLKGQFIIDGRNGKAYRVLKAATGKSFVNGDVVIYDSSDINGLTVTDSTSADDQLIAGVAIDTMAAAAYGRIQVEGVHTAVKVLGVSGGSSAGALLAQSGTVKKADEATTTELAGGILGVALEAIASGADTTKAVLIRLR